jgi:hypothetical protein
MPVSGKVILSLLYSEKSEPDISFNFPKTVIGTLKVKKQLVGIISIVLTLLTRYEELS